MSEPSNWPLSDKARRIRLDDSSLRSLQDDVKSRSCYPTAVGFYPSAIQHSMKRSNHDDFILIFCVDGRGHIALKNNERDNRFEVRKHDIVILPPNLLHEYYADSTEPWTIFWCHFQGEMAIDYFHDIYKDDATAIFVQNSYRYQELFEELLVLFDKSNNRLALSHAVSNLHYLLSLTALESQRDSGTTMFNKSRDKSGKNCLLMEEVQSYLRTHLDKNFDLDTLATQFGLSKFHFSRLYKEYSGYSPMQHLESFRFEQACIYLEFSDLNISQVSYQLGYDDPLYFSRKFKAKYGLSPSEYRKNLKKAF